MHAGADLDPQVPNSAREVERALDRPSRALERGIEAVARSIDLDATPPLKGVPNDGVVSLDQVLPGVIS